MKAMRKSSGRLAGLGVANAILFGFVTFAFLVMPVSAAQGNAYMVTPLVSDNGVPGTTVDPNLVNAWGLVAGPTSPWWVADNGVDMSTLYNAAGTKLSLEVAVAGAPTGVVFNGASGVFLVGTATARFIFDTEGGMILGWAPGSAAATVMVDRSGSGAVYKGLAIATTAAGPRLYATDFVNGHVDAFSSTWTMVATQGGFVDPTLPTGYAPFGIQTIGNRIFVTYGKQIPGDTDEAHGQGFGFVDAFDFDGNFLVRVAQHGQLNAPWGLARAPADFGRFSGDLLVGNFADGHINAYEEMANGHFGFRGFLQTGDGMPLSIDGLWAIQFGNGVANNGPVNTLFFTAGPNDEANGLFGTITVA